ncbi:MAG TPA: HAD family hydrolase [Candidatus Kryptonia bacterium]
MNNLPPNLVKRLGRIRLVATDLDGTLLNNEGRVSDPTKDCVKQMKDLGLRVAIMTARAHSSAERIADELGVEMPIISLDGGLVRLPHSETNIYASYVKPKVVRSVLEAAENHLASVALFVEDKMMRRESEAILPSYIESFELDSVEVENLYEYAEHTVQIIAGAESKRVISTLARAARGIFSGIELKTYRSSHYDDRWYLEIKNKNQSKATGLVHLEKYLNIGKEQVAVIGDFRNDLEAFDRAGVGIAMKNAVWELKQKADLVTEKSNDEDGAAEFFELLIGLRNNSRES